MKESKKTEISRWHTFQKILHKLCFFFIIFWSIFIILGIITTVYFLKSEIKSGQDIVLLVIMGLIAWIIPLSIVGLIFFFTRPPKNDIQNEKCSVSVKCVNRPKLIFLFLLFAIIAIYSLAPMVSGTTKIFKGGEEMYYLFGLVIFMALFIPMIYRTNKTQRKYVDEINQKSWKYQEESLNLQKKTIELLTKIVEKLESPTGKES